MKTEAIRLLTRESSISTVSKRHESEAFGTSSLSVLRKEDTCNATVALEDGAQVSFFGNL